MPKLVPVGVIPVAWDQSANRYLSAEDGAFSEVFNRLKPVLDPMIVTVGPTGHAGGLYPWEGNDPKTGRRYVARYLRDADQVRLEEVVDS